VKSDSLSIQRELEHRASSDTPESELARSLTELAKYVVGQAEAHLKQIVAQHPGFDLHDETHSVAVVENISKLLDAEHVKARSSFELFLLWTSAYLHDCGMAVPQWELNIFQFTEGIATEGANDEPGFRNDLKPTLTYDVAVNLIRGRSQELYGSYSKARLWLFSARSESEFVDDLAGRLRAYQDFRSGHATALRALAGNPEKFATYSNELRAAFIRETHWTRIETWVRNLDELFEDRLGGRWGKALAHDLARICRSHGEGREYIASLSRTTSYIGPSRSDLQLTAMMLRLGDIIHFSADRAPLILYREKLIASPMSRKHWEVKNEGINYSIVNSAERTVRYSAYFQTPALYFLFQDFVDAVDREFALYNELISRTDRGRLGSAATPLLSLHADRSGVRYDPEKFEPMAGLKFSLNQKHILDLLMGVNLYQDRFACLRELYQNALDSCRFMRSMAETKNVGGSIEFGLGTGSVTGEKYLFCRDNGIGMTKDIVARFLLQIGNSFYRSSEFQRLSTNFGSTFTPTSQFGIGILSCFMIGHRMEIVSKPISSLSGATEPISFVIDGPHEHFYYKPVHPADAEAVGMHGTLVKVFLKKDAEDELNNEVEDVAFFQHSAAAVDYDTPFSERAKRWKTNLYHKVSSFVAQPVTGAEVIVRLADNRAVPILRATIPFDYEKLGISRADIEILENARERFRSRKTESGYLDVIGRVISKEVVVEHEGTTFSCILNLPKRGFVPSDSRALNEVRALSKDNGVLVDGITVGKAELNYRYETADSLSNVGVVNFSGRVRPILSVNRMNVVEWPKNTKEIGAALSGHLTTRLLQEMEKYASTEALLPDSEELALAWEYLFSKFSFLAGGLVNEVVARAEAHVPHRELSQVLAKPITIEAFAAAASVELQLGSYHALSQTTKLLLTAKLTSAVDISLCDSVVKVSAGRFTPLRSFYDWDHFRERQYVFRADKWIGRYEQFDLVSAAWPVIPARLFDNIGAHYGDTALINERTKLLRHYGNSLSAVSELDPVLIHQRLGVYEAKHRSFGEQKPSSFVYRFEEARNNFWFLELDSESNVPRAQRSHYLVTAFISPRRLNEIERAELERYRVEDPEYVRGVENGWSILFTGERDLNVLCIPGVASRQQLLDAVPKEFWATHDRGRFQFLS